MAAWLGAPFRFVWRQPWVITAVACAVLLLLPPTGGDLAAQEFHTGVFRDHGALLWNNNWYGGHLLSGYSLLFPPLAAFIGNRLLGAIAAVAGAAAAAGMANRRPGGIGGRLAALWFAIGSLGPFIVGQMPFGFGVACGIASLLAAARGHQWLAAVAALACSLASPLAGAFLAMIALAWALETGWRRVLPVTPTAAGVVVASLFGGGGWFPFPASALVTVLIFVGLTVVLVPDLRPSIRWGVLLYGLASIVVFVVQNPVGGNITRLGALVAGPLAAAVLGARRRWVLLVVLAIPLGLWQMWPTVTALTRTAGDPSSSASYYTGLLGYLKAQDVGAGRVEIPTLRQHWEAYYVARDVPIARGWERQIDLRDNDILYQPDLTADQLHTWLLDSGVRWVAVPDAPLDHWSMKEAALIRHGQPWLEPVWSDAHWRVWRVTDALGLVSGPGTLSRMTVDSFDVQPSSVGRIVVKVRWSPFFQVISGRACISEAPGGWTAIDANQTQRIHISAHWSVRAALHASWAPAHCR